MQMPLYSSAIFKKKKKNTNRHTLIIFKPESIPPPNLSSPTDKRECIQFISYYFFFFLSLFPQNVFSQVALANMTIIVFSLNQYSEICQGSCGPNLMKAATEI